MTDSIRFIKRRIALIEGRGVPGGAQDRPYAATGHPQIDDALGGGVMQGRLHELHAAQDDSGSGAGFAAVLAMLLAKLRCGDLLWLSEEAHWRQSGALHAPGLTAIGVPAARLIVALLPDAAGLLQAAVDAVRCPALGGVVIVLSGDPKVLDLTASRRLALAAETSGVTPLLLRVGGRVAPSAAHSRWRVTAAPSRALPANAPGQPAWDIELLRHRGRPDGGRWRVEWNREQERLHDWHEGQSPPLSGAVVSFSADRSVGAQPPLRDVG